jgi:hypothetical protein
MEVSPTVFVTDDSRMMDGVRDPVDDEVLRSAGMGSSKMVRHITSDEFLKQAQEKQPSKNMAKAELDAAVEGIRRGRAAQSGLIELKPSDWPPLMEAAATTWELFQREVKAALNGERAEYVRQLRVDQRYSWRAVARVQHRLAQGLGV